MVHAPNLSPQSQISHFIKEYLINIENISIPKLSLTTKGPLKCPQNLSSQNQDPSQILTQKNITCYKYGQKSYTFKFYWINTKLYELQLEEEVIHHIQSLLIEASDTKSNLSDPSEELF
jgi:hypothetical protein